MAAGTVGAIISLMISLAIFFFILREREKRKLKKLRESYNEKEDLSKRGERKEGRGRQTGKRRRTSKGGFTRPDQPQGERVLPPTAPTDVGKDSNTSGRVKGFRSFLRKLQKR